MAKQFHLQAEQIKSLARGRGYCFATDMITVDGQKVGCMYREEPDGDERGYYSGWVFMSGHESQEYMDDSNKIAIYDVNTIANYDSQIIPFLGAPYGSAFARNSVTGEFEEEEFEPIDE